MPRGDNLLGPFSEFSKGTVLAFVPCETCSRHGPKKYAPLKVNGHGWLHANCDASMRCGQRRSAYGIASARALIKRAKRWQRGSKARVYELAGLEVKPSEPPPQSQPEPEPAPAPASSHETPRRRRIFGAKI